MPVRYKSLIVADNAPAFLPCVRLLGGAFDGAAVTVLGVPISDHALGLADIRFLVGPSMRLSLRRSPSHSVLGTEQVAVHVWLEISTDDFLCSRAQEDFPAESRIFHLVAL